MKELNINHIRKQFPALKPSETLMDNAGGSQILGSVVNAISEYLIGSNVQLGASYKTSKMASEKVEQGITAMQEFINAKHKEEVVISSSTTMALRLLSLCISKRWTKGDEVIVTNSDHESNRSPWLDLEEKGISVKEWRICPETYELDLKDLENLITPKTKLLAIPHVSNVLGTINPIKAITELAHKHNVLVCVDGVAYAPHRKVDVQELGVDFYVFSTYKTFGPHQAVLYGKKSLLETMDGINHNFIDASPYKFQPGNVNYELTYSLAMIKQYFEEFGAKFGVENSDLIESAFSEIAKHEEALSSRLLSYLNSFAEITIIGSEDFCKTKRVSTISFIHQNLKSDEIVKHIDSFDIGIRYGDFYAVKLIDDLSLRQHNGVVRISLVHYNSMQEVNQLINAFRTLF